MASPRIEVGFSGAVSGWLSIAAAVATASCMGHYQIYWVSGLTAGPLGRGSLVCRGGYIETSLVNVWRPG